MPSHGLIPERGSGRPSTAENEATVPSAALRVKTLVFCTAYSRHRTGYVEAWDERYRRWVRAIITSALRYDQILIIDDGSPVLPDWPGLPVLTELAEVQPAASVVLFHFRDNLGRSATMDYPGWFRSFTFAASYAEAYGFEKIIHIESDAFLITRRIQQYCNDVDNGWVTFLCARHGYPETGLQIIAGTGMEIYRRLCVRPYGDFVGTPIETLLPFTRVEAQFVGDRFGEYLNYVPVDADWTMQTYGPGAMSDEYFWWMRDYRRKEGRSMYLKEIGTSFRHRGMSYLEFMALMSDALSCRSYFEIGTDIGNSVRSFRCDAVCVDPGFKITQDVLAGRRRLHFFQMTSDEFFLHNDLRTYLPAGVDVAFLDGLHWFEALLRDFINTERYTHDRSVILLHDCLPLNERMAERALRIDEQEEEETRPYWTGDVWRLLLILHRYRPDLRVQILDCEPTGLVAVTSLDRYSRILSENYDAIVADYSKIGLKEFGLLELWKLFPTINSRVLSERRADIPTLLFEGAA
jgi:hypothetical protein